jgi:RNA polymerase sigma-70 factor (ECF subfamily)
MQSTNLPNLVQQAQKGNINAVGTLYEIHHPEIYQYLFYRVGDPHIAEELTGEVFLKMVRSLPTYRASNGAFKSWLYAIARNMAIDHYRRTANHPQLAFDDELGLAGETAGEAVELKLTQESLQKALQSLPELQRDVIILRFIEDLPMDEVAALLHKTYDSIKSLQRRALTALRQALLEKEEVA